MTSPSDFSTAELRLVLLSARGAWADDEIRALAEGPLDWPTVTSIASWELATSVLARRLDRLGVSVAPDLVADLRRTGMVEEFRMSELEDRAAKLVRRFEQAGIETVLLKGAGIAAGLPEGFRARPMGDVDLLVHGDRADEAYSLAVECDWAQRTGVPGPEAYDDMPHLRPLIAADGMGFGLEIHTRLFPAWSPFLLRVEDVWARAVPVAGWEGARVPSPEDRLLYACLHFAWSHAFRRGIWRMVRDAEELLADPDLDGDRLLMETRAAKGTSAVYWTLRLLGALTGRPLGQDIVEGLGSPRPRLDPLVLRHLSQEALPRPEAPGTRMLRRFLWSLAIRPRAMGHGRARPWTGVERWRPGADRAGKGDGGSVPARLRGFLSYSLHLSGLA